ncbi:MAG: DUF350 domain-containing protein [Lachnospiraceae bacterium]
MSLGEILLLSGSSALSIRFLVEWYYRSYRDKLSIRNNGAQVFLCCIPVACLAIIYYTLRNLASFDVVDSSAYIFLYIIVGLSWIYISLWLIFAVFNLSWYEDIFLLNDTAAMLAITGGMIGSTLIYSGANIGDGPGWWCVIFAGGLGMAVWLLLGYIINLVTVVFERITVDRNVSAGIRMSGYLIGSGIILGRASAGDWTSFGRTIVEFMDGWPVLILCAIYIVVERYYCYQAKVKYTTRLTIGSILWGIAFIALAIVAVLLLPELTDNAIYDSV